MKNRIDNFRICKLKSMACSDDQLVRWRATIVRADPRERVVCDWVGRSGPGRRRRAPPDHRASPLRCCKCTVQSPGTSSTTRTIDWVPILQEYCTQSWYSEINSYKESMSTRRTPRFGCWPGWQSATLLVTGSTTTCGNSGAETGVRPARLVAESK